LVGLYALIYFIKNIKIQLELLLICAFELHLSISISNPFIRF